MQPEQGQTGNVGGEIVKISSRLLASTLVFAFAALAAGCGLNVAKVEILGQSAQLQCSAFQTYHSQVQPIFQASCVSCHAASQGGLTLSSDEQASYTQAKQRLDLSGDVTQSKLLLKAQGLLSHGGGALLPSDSDGYATLSAWAMAEQNCLHPVSFPTAIRLQPSAPTLAAGSSLQLEAYGTFSSGEHQLIGGLTWASSNASVVVIDGTGKILGLKAGQATVSVSVSGAGRSTVTSSIEVVVNAATLESIKLTPISPSLMVGSSLTFVATANYSDGSSAPLSAGVQWSSSNPTIGSIGSDGLAKALAAGATAISAAYGNLKDQTQLTVSGAPTLTSIAIKPQTISIEVSKTLDAAVIGTYSDGSTQEVTKGITWTSADTTVASVDANGIVKGLKVATTTVHAVVSGKTADATVKVIQTGPSSITVTPSQIYVQTGKALALKATATFPDGSSADVTSSASWTLSDNQLGTFATGTLQALKKGVLTVTATYASKSGTSSLTLLDCPATGTFTSKVTPVLKNNSCTACHSTTLASGGFDGSYKSSYSRIDLNQPSSSLLLAKPTATVSHGGGKLFDANSSPYKDLLGWVVEEQACASLQSITNKSISIRPKGDQTLKVAQTSVLSAMLVRSDGSELDVTTQSKWSSSKTSVATITAGGSMTAVAAGSSVVQASYSSFTDQINVTVSPATLQSISLDSSSVNLSVGGSHSFVATGIYSDGSKKDLTASATWSTSKATVATVASGLATAKAVGTTEITAKLGSIVSDKGIVTVSASGSLELVPGDFSVATGAKLQLQLYYHAPDNSRTLVTSGMGFKSATPAVATVDTKGLVSALESGNSTLTASYNSLSISVKLSVLDCPAKGVFTANVAPVLSTNCATCHSQGNANGGFSADYDTSFARINVLASKKDTDSLLLKKPTGAVAHSGGTLFDSTSTSYKSILGWIDLERACAALPPPVLQSVAAVVQPASIKVGETSVPKAIASFSDLSTQDVTSSSSWSVDDKTVASYAAGKLTALKEGSTSVSATYKSLQASANLKVAGAKLSTIVLAPSSATIEAGHTQAFTATGHYLDGSQADLTKAVSWSVSTPSFASVSDGVITGIKKSTGTQKLTASLLGISGIANFTVFEPTVDKVVLEPASAQVSSGQAVQFKLIEKLSDGTDREVTANATWKSSVENFVSIDAKAYAIAKAPGPSDITASYKSKTYKVTMKVLPASLQSLTIDPTSAYLKVKDTLEFTATAHYTDGTSSNITNGALWTPSDEKIVSVTQQGSIVAHKTGAAKITVSSENLSAFASVDVPACAAVGSVAATFKAKVQPAFHASCVKCHGGSDSRATGEFPIVDNPNAAQLLTNYKKSLSFVDLKESDSIDKSLLLSKSLGNNSHGGGSIFKTSDDGFKSLYSWAMEEKACASAGAVADRLATNLARSSGPVLQLRLQKLFQDPNSATLLPDSDFDAMNATGLNIALGSTERFTTANAQIALRIKTGALCSLPFAARPGELFDSSSDLLLHGESFPTDAALKLAFTAARRAWLSPYQATDTEVIRLAKLYSDIKKVSSADAGKKAVCMAALASPAFWLGNRGPEDTLRRVALEIGREIPKFADYDAFKNATDKTAFLREFVQKFQGKTNGGYYEAINDWFRVQLGLRGTRSLSRFPQNNLVTKINAPLNYGIQGNSELGGMVFAQSATVNGAPKLSFSLPQDVFTYSEVSDEVCDNTKIQSFDPYTSRVVWEQVNPALSTPTNEVWETIAEWKRDDKEDVGHEVTGHEITKADGTKVKTSLADIVINDATKDKDHLGTFQYLKGALVGTPMEFYKAGKRRVHRYGKDKTEQNGVDAIKLWYSGQTAYVCNASARYYTSCFYRPSAPANYPVPLGSYKTWNASVPAPVLFWRSSILNPEVMKQMRCGTPNTAELAKTSGYDDLKAYPMGALGNANSSATNATIPGHLVGQPEDAALMQIADDMDQEPYRLLDFILRSNHDFRELVTAKYTFVHASTEGFYRSQGYFLPADAPGFSDNGSGELRTLHEDDLPAIPFSWLRNNRQVVKTAAENFTPNSVAALHVLDKSAPTSIPHRAFAGILTQPAFFSAAAPKMRTISDRVFERLMCGKPSLFVPDSHQQGLQAQYVPVKEANDKQHVQPGSSCYSCHINMDPLASALSANFYAHVGHQLSQQTSTYEAAGEMFPFVPQPGDMPILNVQNGMGGKSKGALLGVEVEGVENVAQVLSNSNEFAKCMVQTAFTNIFGREPTDKDVDYISEQTVIFQGNGYNYNKMVEEMVASPTFQEQN